MAQIDKSFHPVGWWFLPEKQVEPAAEPYNSDEKMQFDRLFDTSLKAMELLAAELVRRKDHESLDKLVDWVQQILGGAYQCLKDGTEYKFLIDQSAEEWDGVS